MGRGRPGDNNEKSALLRPMSNRRRSAAGKRRVKRRRFSSPLSSEESGTADESDFSSYASTEPHPPRSSRQTSNHSGGPGEDTSDGSGMKIGGQSKSPPASPMVVIYEQQCWAGEIIDEKEVRQGRGRPRKQYLIQWKPSWVDGGRLTAPGLVNSWKEKTGSKRRR